MSAEATGTTQEISIAENVRELLNPVSQESPLGKDAALDQLYFVLDMEIGKISPNYGVCIDLASSILREKSKDLRVASWLCFAWYRIEKISGFVNGLIMIRELLKQYGPALFPASPVYKSKALQVLNSARFVKLLEQEVVNRDNAGVFLEAAKAFEQLSAEVQRQIPQLAPEFKDLGRVLAAHAASADRILTQPPSKEAPRPTKDVSKIPPEKTGRETGPQEKITGPGKDEKKPPAAAVPSAKDFQVASEKDALVAFKKALKFFFQEEKEDSKKFEPYLYGISRSLVWGKLILPSGEEGVTQESSPDSSIMNTLQGWHANRDGDKLIPAVELNFLDEDSHFKWWLTAQRYVVLALEQKGGSAAKAAEEIKFHLARLLMRFPQLPRLKFNSRVPFADDETLKWIDEDVKASLSQEKSAAAFLPPILGEDYEPINQEYMKACAELPQKFEENLQMMEHGLAGESRRKGQFLRLLNIANYYFQARQSSLAKVRLSQLMKKVEDYQLAEWEPALCTAVWEAAYIVNRKLIESEKDKEVAAVLEKEQKDLFSKIGNYNGVLALKLASLNSKKGER
jgi:type VI secretion system protein VasJ